MKNLYRSAPLFAAALLLFLSACTPVHTERREFIPGQAFSADERAWRSTHDPRRESYLPGPDRIKKLDGKSKPPRPAVQREDFTPSRLEPFRGNPRLVR